MKEIKELELWGLPSANGYTNVTYIEVADTVTQVKLQSLGYEFWKFAAFETDENGVLPFEVKS